jgi:hypothetical protein
MSFLQGVEIALEAGILKNTANTAQAAMMPEHVKEAAWLSNGFYSIIRKKTIVPRKAFDGLIFTGLFISITDYNTTHIEKNQSNDIVFTIAVFVLWLFVSGVAKSRARAKANAQAWAIVNEKLMKENTIRDALFVTASNSLRIAR